MLARHLLLVSLPSVIDQKTFDRLLPLACEWAKAQEQFVLQRGTPLGERYLLDAERLGIRDVANIRLLVVDRMPLPEDEQLAEAARQTQIITQASRAVTIGHAIIIRADAWGDRELVLHQLVHVLQCERMGGLDAYVRAYLSNRHHSGEFSAGSLEEEARRMARDLCAPAVAGQ